MDRTALDELKKDYARMRMEQAVFHFNAFFVPDPNTHPIYLYNNGNKE